MRAATTRRRSRPRRARPPSPPTTSWPRRAGTPSTSALRASRLLWPTASARAGGRWRRAARPRWCRGRTRIRRRPATGSPKRASSSGTSPGRHTCGRRWARGTTRTTSSDFARRWRPRCRFRPPATGAGTRRRLLMRYRGRVCLAIAAMAFAVAASTAQARVLLVGSWHGHRGPYRSIQAAVDVARPGDWVLIGRGDYHERGDREKRYRRLADIGAGVMITTPRIHVRGMDRNRVVIDGTKPGSKKCASTRTAQDFGPVRGGKANGRNGIEAYKAPGVTIENLTVCNFLEGSGSSGNEVWFNFGDGSGKSLRGSFRGAYLNATSTYFEPNRPAASYGIFSSNNRGPGLFAHTYASNMNDSDYYIGACTDCNQRIVDAHAQYSALGYSGTNSGGRLVIERSEWDHNQSGIVTTSQNNDDAPSPQLGLCPGSTTKSCTFFRDNFVHDNNNPNVPQAGTAALGPVGSGM